MNFLLVGMIGESEFKGVDDCSGWESEGERGVGSVGELGLVGVERGWIGDGDSWIGYRGGDSC